MTDKTLPPDSSPQSAAKSDETLAFRPAARANGDPWGTTPPEAGTAESGRHDLSALPPPSVTLPAETGRYAIRGEIARGGMGAVLLGHDAEMDRDLAIKVLQDQYQEQPGRVRRFFDEARVNGRLQHPGVVPIYEMGRLGGCVPFFTMKLVEGRTLAALLHERADPKQDVPRFLQVFAQVCETLAYAHAKGVIHRDLKPANIMVGAFGEVQVMDWGLAKVLADEVSEAIPQDHDPAATVAWDPNATLPPASAEAHATAVGTVMGTPAYMAPEQARGEVHRLDERCDVFGLGAILCQILTGKPPYTGSAADVQLRSALGELEAAHARLEGSSADPELLRLARACLAAQPQARPRNAGAVAEALKTYLNGVQERLHAAELERAAAQARAAQARAKAAAERRARRLTFGLAAALVALVVAAGGIWAWWAQRRVAANASVGDALLEAARQRERARASGDDLKLWAEAVSTLRSVQALASGVDCDDPLRQQVDETLSAAAEEERQAQKRRDDARAAAEKAEAEARQRAAQEREHRQMLTRLDEIRMHLATRDVQGVPDYWRVLGELEQFFRDCKIDLDDLAPDAAAERLRAYPAPVCRALAGALDQWVQADWSVFWTDLQLKAEKGDLNALKALTGGGDQPGVLAHIGRWSQRLKIAQLADPDPARKRLRERLQQFDVAAFNELARSEDPTKLPPDAAHIMAQVLAHTGDVPGAANLLARAVQVHPDDFWTQFYLGTYYSALGPATQADALRHYTAARALRPDVVLPLRAQAITLWQMGKEEEAIPLIEHVLRLEPKNADGHFVLSSLLRKRGDPAGAVRHARAAVAARPNSGTYHKALALALEDNGESAAALAEYRAAMAANSHDGDALGGAGRILLARRELAEAETVLRKAIAAKPTPTYWRLLGDVLRARGQRDPAIAAYRQAIKTPPGSSVAYAPLGLLLLQKGQVDEALVSLREAVRLQPDRESVNAALVSALQAKRDLPGAIAARRELLRRWPSHAGARARQAADLRQLGQQQRQGNAWDAALVSFREALALEPDHPDAIQGLGYTQWSKGQYAEAADTLRQATQLRQGDAVLWRSLGWCSFWSQRVDEAIGAFRQALELEPRDASAHYGLGKCFLAQEDFASAAAAIRQTVQVAPPSYTCLCDLATALRHDKQPAEAVAVARKAVALAPDGAQAYLVLAEALVAQGKLTEALGALEEAMRKHRSLDTAHRIAELFVRKGSQEEALAYLMDPVEPRVLHTAQSYLGLLALEGKTDDRRAGCAALLKRYERTTDAESAFLLARSLAQAPGSGTDPAEAVRLGELAVRAKAWPWSLNALALAHYRAGHDDKAVTRAQESLKANAGWHPQLNWVVLALAERRRGHKASAEQWLQQVRKAGPLAGANPQDVIVYELLRREVEAAATAPPAKK
jgi:serine/threonine-protein kinase